MRSGRFSRKAPSLGALVLWLLGISASAMAEETLDDGRRWKDTGRLYVYTLFGQAFLLDDDAAPGVELDTPGANPLLGFGFGYNISDHWGVELQFAGTEVDLRSPTLGKLGEYSNITAMPAARFRWPLGDGRLVPWVTAGLGASWNDVNDSTSEATRFTTDELTIAGSLAAGFDYFLADDVAVGLGLHSFFYPQQHTDYLVVDSSGRHQTSGSLNYNSFAVAGHLRFFLGEAAAAGESGPRHLFLAEHGPFDTDEMRGYATGLFGYTPLLDDDFGDGVRHASGDINITTGGALGMNFDRHWGAEVQMLVVDRDLVQGSFGKVGEISVFSVVPTLRFRYPFLQGRLVPFATAGVGVGFVSTNDHQPYFENVNGLPRLTPSVGTGGPGVVGAIGVGVEYFLNHHVSVGVVVPVQFGPAASTTVQNPGQKPVDGHLNGSTVGGMFRLSVYAP